VHAADPIDLELARGEFLAVVGPSECGRGAQLSMRLVLNHLSCCQFSALTQVDASTDDRSIILVPILQEADTVGNAFASPTPDMAGVHPKTDVPLQRFGCSAWPIEDVRFWDIAMTSDVLLIANLTRRQRTAAKAKRGWRLLYTRANSCFGDITPLTVAAIQKLTLRARRFVPEPGHARSTAIVTMTRKS
jgi:hypothetical protein